MDTEYYCKEYLRTEDSQKVDEIELLKEEVLDDSAITEFFESRTSLNGDLAKSLIESEILKPFADFLRERIDYYICDFIISRIDDYPDEEYAVLKETADKKKRLLLAGANE